MRNMVRRTSVEYYNLRRSFIERLTSAVLRELRNGDFDEIAQDYLRESLEEALSEWWKTFNERDEPRGAWPRLKIWLLELIEGL